MKLTQFTRKSGYLFILTFANGECLETDLRALLGGYVDAEGLDTAHLDTEWGCLEFKDGMVDIEPKTLYRYAKTQAEKQVA